VTTQYDPAILQEYADALYREAKTIVYWRAFSYAAVTFLVMVVAAFIAAANQKSASLSGQIFVIPTLLAGIGALVGAFAGKGKAFCLKLQAQQILCQWQIEQNLRASGNVLAHRVGV
jgi:hypothetical protein